MYNNKIYMRNTKVRSYETNHTGYVRVFHTVPDAPNVDLC